MNVWLNTRGWPSTFFLGVKGGFALGPPPCVTFPETVIRRDGGWLPVSEVSAVVLRGGRAVARSPTGDRVTVKRLHFVLSFWHLHDKIANALGAFVRVPVPTHS